MPTVSKLTLPEPSSGSGSEVTVSSDISVNLAEYQCVASHGNEAVPDAETPTTVSHYPDRALLTRYNNKNEGLVHVPIHNPPAATTKLAYLKNIIVKFDTTRHAEVDWVALYYDSKDIVTVSVDRDDKKSSFHITFTDTEPKDYAYVIAAGISVTLHLKFPNSDSSIDLYSVTIVYKET